MKVIADEFKVPILSWLPDKGGTALEDVDSGTWVQATNLAQHPVVWKHVALMPDAHSGYGMPIGGVIACVDAVIPNAVGKDIGCGMCSVRTNLVADMISMETLEEIRTKIKKHIPHGEGNVNRDEQDWDRFDEEFTHNESYPDWFGPDPEKKLKWFKRSLCSLGGGNHFIELQAGNDGYLWVTLHSGSRNLGSSICDYYHTLALELNHRWHANIPCDHLAFLPVDSKEGREYLRYMNFALDFALENRKRMMQRVKDTIRGVFRHTVEFTEEINIHHHTVEFTEEINIHHNYAAKERHFGKDVWVHRKGATLAEKGTKGVIPGSMGAPTYIVEGLGNRDSFNSCSHGAGRKMGRMDACRTLDKAECEKSMEGILYDGFGTVKRKKIRMDDLGEAPGAYKDIDEVMAAQEDLVDVKVKLIPRMVVKG